VNAGELILQLGTPDAVRKGGVHTIIPAGWWRRTIRNEEAKIGAR
jgi:hypothetical protein